MLTCALGDCYYNLGEETGGLDRHGRRLRTIMAETLGYVLRCSGQELGLRTVRRVRVRASLELHTGLY